MKKIFILLMLVLSLTMVGCSSDGDKQAEKEDDSIPNEEVKKEQPEDVTETDKEEPQEVEQTSEFYFDGEVAEIEDVKVKITETKVIPVGEAGNEYGEKPVFAIWYEATNKTDEDIDPMTAWLAMFEAIQDNDPNAINTLEVGSLPDEAHLDSQMETIKKDGTVENSIAYELDDEVTPVTLVATKGMLGEEIGRHDFNIE